MSKHTIGPWTATRDPNAIMADDWCIGAQGQIDSVAVCSERDARLIAAAPELLDALIKARHYVSINRNSMVETCTRPDGSMHIDDEKIVAEYDAVLEQIDTALSKAT